MTAPVDAELVAAAFAGRKPLGWQRADCPLCLLVTGKPDTRQSLSLNFSTGGFVCWKCGTRGRCAEELGIDAAADLGADVDEQAGADEEERRPVEEATGFVPLWEGMPGATAEATRWARDYLEGRGVSWQAVEEAQIGCALRGPLAGRIVVPYLALDGEWAGWVARDVSGKSRRKYKNAEGMERTLLWHHAALLEDTTRPVFLVEGVFDALPLWPDVCAFLGKPTDEHVGMLERHAGRPLVLVLDGDAWEEGWALGLRLEWAGVDCTALRLPPGSDPGELGLAGVQGLLRDFFE